MKLTALINDYIQWKTSLGMSFRTDKSILKSFIRKMGDIDLRDVQPVAVLEYLNGHGGITSFWHQKYKVLKGFYQFAIGRGYIGSSPLPKAIPKCPPPSPPYIYTLEELRQLLKVTETLKTPKSPLQSDTFRILFLILYGAAIRVNEARLLTFTDVNLHERILLVRNTKFHKTRLVPIGKHLAKELCSYSEKRRKLPRPYGKDSAFLCSRTGTFLSYERINKVFRRLRQLAGVHREDGARYQPRLHDLRHTSAVHRLADWYRTGKDLNRLLPILSTYLGHVELSSTQHYLTLTQEILNQASRRFELYMQSEVTHG